jgi:hypothetical protein
MEGVHTMKFPHNKIELTREGRARKINFDFWVSHLIDQGSGCQFLVQVQLTDLMRGNLLLGDSVVASPVNTLELKVSAVASITYIALLEDIISRGDLFGVIPAINGGERDTNSFSNDRGQLNQEPTVGGVVVLSQSLLISPDRFGGFGLGEGLQRSQTKKTSFGVNVELIATSIGNQRISSRVIVELSVDNNGILLYHLIQVGEKMRLHERTGINVFPDLGIYVVPGSTKTGMQEVVKGAQKVGKVLTEITPIPRGSNGLFGGEIFKTVGVLVPTRTLWVGTTPHSGTFDQNL